MRALFVTGSLVHGGAERHSIGLMNRLAERGNECHAVYVKDDRSQLERIRLRGRGSVRCLHAGSYLDRGALAAFAEHMVRVAPSVIVAANTYAAMYASLGRRLAGQRVPLAVTFHSTRLLGLKEQVKMLMDRVLLLDADCLVYVSENQRGHWRRRGLRARRDEVIHNGVDPDLFRAADFQAAAREVRRRFGFADGDYVIGMVAVLRPEKNHLQLVDGISALRSSGIPARALLIGDGPMRAAIAERAHSFGLDASTAITGYQEDVRPYVAACDAVALCSVTEAFSLAAIEAMAMARPVVHSNVGGASEMIRPGHNGFLFPVGDTDRLVRQLALLAEPSRAARMGENARRVVEDRFSEASMVDRYESLLLGLCDRSRGHDIPRHRDRAAGPQYLSPRRERMNGYDEVLDSIKSSPNTWLVTGAAGFIGSHLVETLLKLDQNVVGLDNFSSGKRDNVTAVMKAVGAKRSKNLRFIDGDIRSLQTCRTACRGVDRVLHQAAVASVPRSMGDPIESNATNVDGFLNMLVAARDAGVARVVYAASSSTYGDTKRLPFVENEIGRPLSPYALTKYINELYADLFARCYGTQAIGLRYFNVFGPRQDPDGAYAAVIPKWISALLRDEPVYINGDGTTARDFCYIDNVVQANLLAAMVSDPAAVNQVYNVAMGAQTSLDELFLMIRVLLAPSHPPVMKRQPTYREFRPGDMHISRADVSKAQSMLGYRPVWDVREGLKWALDWYVATLSGEPAEAGDAKAGAAELKAEVLP